MDQTNQASSETQSLRTVLESLFRYKRLLGGVVGVVLILALTAVILPQKRYLSEMKLLIQNARTNAVITADRTAMPSTGDVTEQQINSELEVLQSEDVLSKVADPDWVAGIGAKHTFGEIKQHEMRLLKLRRQLSFESARKSNVIQVTSLGTDPTTAANTLKAIWEAYMAKRKELSRPRGATEFFKREADRYSVEWDDASRSLAQFQEANQLVSVPDREDELRRQIEDVDNQLRLTGTGVAESSRKMKGAAVALANVPPRQTTVQRTISNQYSVEQMQTTLLQLTNKRTELLTRYKPTDRLVKELETQISQTTAALQNANSQRGQEDTTDVDPLWQQLHGNLTLEKVNHGALLGRQESLQKMRNDLELELSRAQGLAIEYADLKARADEAQNNFKLFTEKYDQAQIEDDMDRQALVNVAIAENPTMSYRPYSPRPLQTMAIAMLTALFLGVGLVYIAELSRTTISTARELGAFSSRPVLASIPLERPRLNLGGWTNGSKEFNGSPTRSTYSGEPEIFQTLQRGGAGVKVGLGTQI